MGILVAPQLPKQGRRLNNYASIYWDASLCFSTSCKIPILYSPLRFCFTVVPLIAPQKNKYGNSQKEKVPYDSSKSAGFLPE